MERITERWIGKRMIERLKIGEQLLEFDLHLSMSFSFGISQKSNLKIGIKPNAELILELN